MQLFDPCPSGRPLNVAIAAQRKAERKARAVRFAEARHSEAVVLLAMISERMPAYILHVERASMAME